MSWRAVLLSWGQQGCHWAVDENNGLSVAWGEHEAAREIWRLLVRCDMGEAMEDKNRRRVLAPAAAGPTRSSQVWPPLSPFVVRPGC